MDGHEENIMRRDRFAVKVLRYSRTSFERQILESCLIQENRVRHEILNSKSEYNRCALPRLSSRVGDAQFRSMSKEEKEEKLKENEMLEKIRKLKKQRNKNRRDEEEEHNDEFKPKTTITLEID